MEGREIEQVLGRAPRLAIGDIVSHPNLPEARKLYLDCFLDLYGNDPFLARLLIETGRFMVVHIAFILDAAHDPARRETWPTLGLLKQMMARFGFASGRHIDQLLQRLCEVGFMELRQSDEDKRVRLVSPTERLRAHDREWLAAHYAPLAMLFPAHDYGPIIRRDPQFQALHRRTSLSFMQLGAKLMMGMPDMMLFLNRAVGYPVIAALLQSAMAEPDHPHARVPYGDVGDRFGVSRTHVRKLLVAAEEVGLVKLHGRGGRHVEVLPRLWSSHDHSIAGGMYLHDIIYLATSSRAGAITATSAAAAC